MDLKVSITTGESVCSECGEELGHHAWITPVEGQGAAYAKWPSLQKAVEEFKGRIIHFL